MPGSNAGTGQPLNFMCSTCRRQRWRRKRGHYGSRVDVTLTGRVRKAKLGTAGVRSSRFMFEYHCPFCKHTGWSRHNDMERLYQREYGGSINDLKKVYPDEFRFERG